jgi:hypothetical protein
LTRRFQLDPRKEPAETRNSFCIAVEAGCLEAARELAETYRLNVRDVRVLRAWPLRTACAQGDEAMVRWLVERFPFQARDVRVYACDALRRAAANGHAGVLRLLRERFKLEAKDARARNNDALRQACAGGHAETVRVLLNDYGLGLADVADGDAAAIRWAVDGRHCAVVSVLRAAFGMEAIACLYSASALPDGVARALVGFARHAPSPALAQSPTDDDIPPSPPGTIRLLPPSQLGGGGLPRKFGAPKPRSTAKSDSMEDRLLADTATQRQIEREDEDVSASRIGPPTDAVFQQALEQALAVEMKGLTDELIFTAAGRQLAQTRSPCLRRRQDFQAV